MPSSRQEPRSWDQARAAGAAPPSSRSAVLGLDSLMQKILLVNPFVERMHMELSYAENFRPPLGLAYCASVLEQEGYDVDILDALVLGVRFPKLRRILASTRPDVVGISSYSPTRYECFRTAAVVKEVLPQAVVIMGGPHVSAVAEDTLHEVPHVDHIVRGEGEYALLELLRTLESRGDPSQVGGVSTRVDGEIVEAPTRPNIPELDALPPPARNLLPMKSYRTRMPSTMHACTTTLTSRGCPARCTFCTRDWFSRDTRFHSAQYMVDEIEGVVSRWGIRGFIMQDDTFTLNKRRIFEFCDALTERKLDVRWLATTRVDCLNLDLLKAMKAAGCEVVTFGIESMNPETLKWLKKGFTVEKVRRAIDWCNEVGLVVRGSYLMGIGDETEEDIQRSASLARELKLDKLKANVGLSVYPGTPLYQMAIDSGILPPGYSYARGWQDPENRYGNGETPRWYTQHVPLERLLQLRRETEVNVLFTRPSVRSVAHKARKLVTRFRRHPAETTKQVANLARAVIAGSGLRRTATSATEH